MERPGVAARLVRCLLLCLICAIPSIIWGSMLIGGDPAGFAGMGLGIAVVVAVYVAVTATERYARFVADDLYRRTLSIGYGTRIGVAVLFPVGMGIDLAVGLGSFELFSRLTRHLPNLPKPFLGQSASEAFTSAFALTLLHALLLHVVLVAYMFVVYWVLRWLGARHGPRNPDLCIRCGYDLRASRLFGRCPECGTPCAPAGETTRTMPDAPKP